MAADQIETLVTDALKARSAGNDADGDARAILQSVQRIIAQKENLRVEMADAADGEDRVLEIPWTPRGSGRPKREVLEPAVGVAGDQRPMRSEVRATLVRAIALGRLWLQELTSGKVKDTGEIAVRED